MLLKKIVVGPLSVNCFILGCSHTNQAAVIDPGDEVDKIAALLSENNLSLKYILLTHGHVDHVAGVEKIKLLTEAEILMHKGDEFLFDTLSAQAMMFGLPDPGRPKADQYLDEGEKINIGDIEVKVFATPGHSPGSVTYNVDNNLFVGDLVFAGSIGRTDLPGGNYDTLIHSVNSKIFTMPDDSIIYPGHGPSSSVGREKQTNPYF